MAVPQAINAALAPIQFTRLIRPPKPVAADRLTISQSVIFRSRVRDQFKFINSIFDKLGDNLSNFIHPVANLIYVIVAGTRVARRSTGEETV